LERKVLKPKPHVGDKEQRRRQPAIQWRNVAIQWLGRDEHLDGGAEIKKKEKKKKRESQLQIGPVFALASAGQW
jgi:hypothetical protein